MRIWNGLKINDKIIYKNEIYLITQLYEKDGERLCNLFSQKNKNELKGIKIYECIRYDE